jgi:hypothetical protein
MLVMAARYADGDDRQVTCYRTVVLGVLAWVLVVTAGATLVWTVISRAGEGVAGDLPVTATETTSPRETPSERATRTASPSESSSSPAPSQSTPSSSSEEPVAEPARRAWQGAAGIVIAECRGSAISLKGAQPASGWSVEVDDTGPDRVRVEFESGDARTRVEARCAGGAPEFEVDVDPD